MEQKRLFLAIAISLAILLGFQMISGRFAPPPHHPATVAESTQSTSRAEPIPAQPPQPSDTIGATPSDAGAAPVGPSKPVPRLQISGPQVEGSMSLVGARLDDLVLRDYHETIQPNSPLVRLLEPRSNPQPYYVRFGWSAELGAKVKLPDENTLWTASAPSVSPAEPVTLSWNNGEGLTFKIVLSIDDHYMFTVEQRVKNDTGAPVMLFPWSSVFRDYTPQTAGNWYVHEGLIGWLDGLKEDSYSSARSEAAKKNGIARDWTGKGGWAGFTDKYWLVAVVPDQTAEVNTLFGAGDEKAPRYQVYSRLRDPQQLKPGSDVAQTTHLFAGPKVVSLIDRYKSEYNIPGFDKAVDFGWLYFLSKPIFLCLDWLYHLLGNFGVAILVFTLLVKAAFFPLANKSYRSMSKMRLLGPKMQSARERFKDDPAKLQQEMMAIYRAEGVNPVSGCLPMLIQMPVFFALYTVMYTTIEMRQAPFFGWIHDLSAADPTNVFNLFGLIPFDPTTISPFLHLGVWPLIMGLTMYFQQRLNPPPPDPTQAKLFQFMPVIFTFMMGRFPAGLVIYWTWNNLLSIAQQWLIMRNTRLGQRPKMART